MEKLKAKHDHKLTDILKVAIFGLMLILPFLNWLPSGLYYAFNEHAVTENETIEKYETKQVDFNQLIQGDFPNVTFNANVRFNITNSTDYSIAVRTTSNFDSYITVDFNTIPNHKYYFSWYGYLEPSENPSGEALYYPIDDIGNLTAIQVPTTLSKISYIFTARSNFMADRLYAYDDPGIVYLYSWYVVDLTQMFGEGNEPTLQQFNELYPKNYYDYTTSKLEIIDIPTGETTTYTNITNQLVYNWQSLWNSPLFYWTNVSILNTGLTNFCNVLGINATSYITNFITYELIIVTIYIIIDIVIQIFKWLTHLIGEK